MTGIGHNTVAGDRLKSFVERAERLEAEKAEVAEHVKEVYAEAKSTGLDVKTIRKIVSLRKIALAERQEQEALLDLYMHALGMAALED